MALRRVLAITRKSLGQLSHDRRTVVFVLAVPLVLILVFGYGFGGQPTHIAVVVVNADHGTDGTALLAALPAGVLDLSPVADNQSAWAAVNAGNAWAAILIGPNFSLEVAAGHATLTLYLDGTSPTISAAVVGAVNTALQKAFAGASTNPPLKVASDYVYGSASTPFIDTLAPGIMALATLFATTVLSIVVLVREKTGGILERLFASPLRPSEFVAGHALSLTCVALGQSTVLLAASVLIFHATFVGSLPLAFGILLLFAFGNLGLGMLLSAASKSEFQAIQFIPLLLFPQILFAGALFPLETIPVSFRPVADVLPLTYAGRALQDVLLRGWGPSGVAVPVLALVLYATVTLLGATVLVRRQA